MIDPEHNILTSQNFKEIEDIIDARKLLGQYNVYKQTNGINYRYVYSSSTGGTTHNKLHKFDETVVHNEENMTNNSNIKQTDSEITVVLVKCGEVPSEARQSKWDMHDIAIPGDGSHLGDSPSLVNLATLVGHNIPCEGEEYLVPLSSWDPYLKQEDVLPDWKCCSESNFENTSCNKKNIKPETHNSTANSLNTLEKNVKIDAVDLLFRRPSWAGRISKFIRKHCKKSKTLPGPDRCLNKN